MFKLFKKGIKGVLNKFSKKVEEAPEEKVEAVEEVIEEIEEQPRLEGPEKEEAVEEKPEADKVEVEEGPETESEKKVEVKEAIEEPKAVPQPVEEAPVEAEPETEPEAEETVEVPVVEEKETPEVVEKESPSLEKVEIAEEPVRESEVEHKKETERRKIDIEEKSRGLFGRIKQSFVTKKIDGSRFDDMFWDLEVMLLENNVAVEVIEKIKQDLKSEIVDKPIPRGKVEEVIANSLHNSMEDLFSIPPIDFLDRVKSKKPYVICFVGINGSGKTTTIAKVANFLKQQGLSVVLAAADTFRAAAIDQLQIHADRLGVKLIKHDYGSDPAAVAFDAIKHAKSTEKDVVLIDTAGRLHSDLNLMQEMQKIIRVADPDLKLFVGESITGNDCIEQAEKFNEAIGIDGIVLSKADIDEKGGAAISVSYVTKKPIVFLGVGQEYDDLELFDKDKLLSSIGI